MQSSEFRAAEGQLALVLVRRLSGIYVLNLFFIAFYT